MSIASCTPVTYARRCSIGESAFSTLSHWFYLGGERAIVVAENRIRLETSQLAWHTRALKIASYILFFPFTPILFAVNWYLHSQQRFIILSSSGQPNGDLLQLCDKLSSQYSRLQTSREAIQNGYGEFVIFYKNAPHTSVHKSIYDEAYAHLSGCDRSDAQAAVQRIDSALDIAVIPRTLYELIVIEAAIQEELDDGELCALQDEGGYGHFHHQHIERERASGASSNQVQQDQDYVQKKLDRCWHLCRFSETSPADNQHPFVKRLAFRTNNLIVNKLRLGQVSTLTGQHICQQTEEQIRFLVEHRRTFSDLVDRGGFRNSAHIATGGAVNFGCSASAFRGQFWPHPVGIDSESDKQTIRNAIALECDPSVQNAFILYRGGYARDDVRNVESDSNISLSYGTSLFAGVFRDGTACTFYYGKQQRDVYALVIPRTDSSSPFYIPRNNAICQLFSQGELFHARSKLPPRRRGNRSSRIVALGGPGEARIEIIAQGDTPRTLAAKFRNYTCSALWLRAASA